MGDEEAQGAARLESSFAPLVSAGVGDQKDSFLIWRKPMHVLEGFAGKGNTSELAEEFGLKAGPLVDTGAAGTLPRLRGSRLGST